MTRQSGILLSENRRAYFHINSEALLVKSQKQLYSALKTIVFRKLRLSFFIIFSKTEQKQTYIQRIFS